LPAELSAEAADDPLGVEGLPVCRWRGLGKGPFGLDELVYEVAPGRCAPERVGKLGVSDQPVRIEGGPVVVCAVMRYTTSWTSPASWSRSLTRWVRSSMPETYGRARRPTIGTRGPAARQVRRPTSPCLRLARCGSQRRCLSGFFRPRSSSARGARAAVCVSDSVGESRSG
jgi:hypothetical protein